MGKQEKFSPPQKKNKQKKQKNPQIPLPPVKKKKIKNPPKNLKILKKRNTLNPEKNQKIPKILNRTFPYGFSFSLLQNLESSFSRSNSSYICFINLVILSYFRNFSFCFVLSFHFYTLIGNTVKKQVLKTLQKSSFSFTSSICDFLQLIFVSLL